MTDFDYKKYSLENLEKWMSDALISAEATPKEIYDIIHKVVEEEYYYFKHQTGRCYELLALLKGNGKEHLTCDKDDKSPECQNAWNDFWEEYYYPEEHQKHTEEVKDNGMRPWGHSDLEYMIANPTLTEDRVSNFPGEQYTEEELNAMCDSAKKEDKVVKWQLPVQVDGLSGECFVEFPDDLLEAANLKENDLVSWIDRGDGSFELRKVTKPIGMEESKCH
jgi:hypothetical protein